MNAKLTLSLDQTTIDRAKVYAKSHSKSLSHIVEEYLKALTGTTPSDGNDSADRLIEELQGSVNMPATFSSYKELLEDILVGKYLKGE